MDIIYSGKNKKVIEASEFVNELFQLDEFWDELGKVNQFDYSDLSTQEIVARIKNCTTSLNIRLYRPKWRWSKANAYVTAKYPNTLFLNSRKLWRSTSSLVNTIVHESVHIADYGDDDQKISFGHGSNSAKGKENSAPYWIGLKASDFFENTDDDLVEIEKIEIDNDLIEE